MSDTSIPPMVSDRAAQPVPNRSVPPVPGIAGPLVPDRIPRPTQPAANSANNTPRIYRRVSVPVQQPYMPSMANSVYPTGAYPFNYPGRPYMNMNMGGLNSGYNSLGAYGQPIANQFQNP